MIKPAPKNQDGKLYQNMPNQASFILTRRKGKIHGCFIRDNKLIRLTTDEEYGRTEGMICIAKVMDIVPNINAAFLRIAGERKCFIKLDDLQTGYNLTRPGMKFASGDNVLVQIIKEASKGKEAGATCAIRMEGRLCVITPGKSEIFYSHKISQRRKSILKQQISETDFEPAENIRIIIRTEAENEEITGADISKEAEELCIKFRNLSDKAHHRCDYAILCDVTPKYLEFLLSMEGNSCDKILTDDKEIHGKVQTFLSKRRPDLVTKLHLYEDCLVPLNVLYGLEGKLGEVLSDKVWLKSGGFLYIEPTQAMTVIDVNSGKYDKKSDNEETYFRINMEAAEEIATQIFLRNLTGIIVIDFINMAKKEHNSALLKALTELLKNDANPGRVFGFTRLGLVEITRKKRDKTIYEQILV